MDNLEQALLESENSLMLLSDEELITPINDILIINPETRLIEVPSTELLLGVFSENLVEKKYFKCPRIVLNNIDLYECFIFINYVSASGRVGYIQSENVELDETEQYILFDWDLTNNVFDKNKDSTIYFSVSAKQYLEDSEPVFATRKAQGKMYETINGTEHVTKEHADIILQILAGMKTKVDLPKDEDGNLLVPEEGQTLLFKEDGTTYYGTPSSGGGTSFSGSAKDVTYDDTETKLGAENVQDAIGKLSSEKAEQTDIPTKTSQLTNDSGFLIEKPTYTASEVGADASGTAQTKVSEHNVSEESHSDIRLLISSLTTKINGILDSEDVDLDQLSELVAYIKSNRSLIEEVTTNKVNVSDIIDNLTTSVSNKPLSAKQGVLLKILVDDLDELLSGHMSDTSIHVTSAEKNEWNNKQPSGDYALRSEIPTVPVQSVNGKTGAVVLDAEDVGATTQAYVDAEILDLEIRTQQQNLSFAVGETQEEAEAWLKANGDTTKAYIMPDDFYWKYKAVVVNTGPSYTNMIPLAINSDGTPYVGTNGEKGYKTNYRLNSSRNEVSATDRCCTGFIPVKYDDVVRIKNMLNPKDNTLNGYIHFYGSDFTSKTGMAYEQVWGDGVYEFKPSEVLSINGANINASELTAYMRISTGVIDDTSIVTINEEIVEGSGGTTIEYQWASTGHKFNSSNYDKEISNLVKTTDTHAVAIAELKDAMENFEPETDTKTDAEKLALIKDWDAPIYDAHIPVFQLSAEKQAMTNATGTPDNIYAMYDALMAKHPKYITKTDLGLCSDGVNHVYRYDFREPEPLHESNKEWSETKAKAIIITGIHFEWAGIYSLYYALEEIANNPELRNLRRNTHLIVVPVANPYATIANNYQSGLSTPNSYGVRNANGVEIHRNFEVDWVLTEEGTTHYGGAEPLSEVETQYIDNIMKNNTDASLFLSCHNCGVDIFWGTGFIWSSTATKYMCNLGYRLVDKMSDAWMDKYGDILSVGIEEYKTDLLEDGDTRLGWAGLSSTVGTEAKQATKYGIQGTNIETCNPFQIHGTKTNPEPSMSSFTMSRGAEVYINFLLTAFGVYDHKDKEEYYK